jgi:hypothetical protein
MPDAFGNPTPQEVIQGIQSQSRQSFLQAQQTGSPGVQAGASLAALFGPAIKKTLDTRRARKDEATRLMRTKGLDRAAAEEQAKASIGREHAEVRRARTVQEATLGMQEFMDNLPRSIPLDMRNAQGKLFLSNRMRNMGLTTEANNLALQANEEMAAAEQAQLERDNLKARTRATTAQAAVAEAELPFVGATPFLQNVLQKEQMIARLNDPQSNLTQEGRDSLMRGIGHLEAKILKDETIVGRTEDDVRQDPTLMRKLFNDISDAEVLLANLAEADEALAELDSFDSTVIANWTKDFLGFMEKTFGRKPDEGEREFMNRIIEKQGKPTIIAAKIRHALTGAQMSAFEIVFLTPFLPQPSDSPEVMRGKMEVVRQYTQLDVDTRMAMFQRNITGRFFESGGVLDDGGTLEEAGVTPAAGADARLEQMIREREAAARNNTEPEQ